MAKSLNQCNFIGRNGKPLDIKYTASGSAIANFSIACNDDYKDKNGQKVEQTNWINCVAFGKAGEILGQYLNKGDLVYISGKQVTRKWQDKEGKDRYTTEIVVNEFQFIGGKSEPQERQQPSDYAKPSTAKNDPMVDDGFDSIPF